MYTITTNAEWRIASANSTIAVQVTGSGAVYLGLGSNTVSPVAGFIYEPHQGDRGDLSTLFPTATGTVLWARSTVPSEITLG